MSWMMTARPSEPVIVKQNHQFSLLYYFLLYLPKPIESRLGETAPSLAIFNFMSHDVWIIFRIFSFYLPTAEQNLDTYIFTSKVLNCLRIFCQAVIFS